MTRTAAVIGAGFGGLALAIRLQSAGIATTIVEARDKPGGRAYFWEKEGFTFDDFEVEHDFPSLGRRRIRLNARPVPLNGAAGAELIVLGFEDVTEVPQP